MLTDPRDATGLFKALPSADFFSLIAEHMPLNDVAKLARTSRIARDYFKQNKHSGTLGQKVVKATEKEIDNMYRIRVTSKETLIRAIAVALSERPIKVSPNLSSNPALYKACSKNNDLLLRTIDSQLPSGLNREEKLIQATAMLLGISPELYNICSTSHYIPSIILKHALTLEPEKCKSIKLTETAEVSNASFDLFTSKEYITYLGKKRSEIKLHNFETGTPSLNDNEAEISESANMLEGMLTLEKEFLNDLLKNLEKAGDNSEIAELADNNIIFSYYRNVQIKFPSFTQAQLQALADIYKHYYPHTYVQYDQSSNFITFHANEFIRSILPVIAGKYPTPTKCTTETADKIFAIVKHENEAWLTTNHLTYAAAAAFQKTVDEISKSELLEQSILNHAKLLAPEQYPIDLVDIDVTGKASYKVLSSMGHHQSSHKMQIIFKSLSVAELQKIADIYNHYYKGIDAKVTTNTKTSLYAWYTDKEKILPGAKLTLSVNTFIARVLPVMANLTKRPSYLEDPELFNFQPKLRGNNLVAKC